MPPKKNKEPPVEVDTTAKDMNVTLTQECEILQREIMTFREEALRVTAVELELKARVDEMEKDLSEEKEGTLAVTANMARQFKSLQEQLIAKLNALETILTDHREELDMTEHELEELRQEKNEKIADRDNQIKSLRSKMDTMEREFAAMLQRTCTLMEASLREGIFAQNEYDLLGVEGVAADANAADAKGSQQQLVSGGASANGPAFGRKFDESDKRMRMGVR